VTRIGSCRSHPVGSRKHGPCRESGMVRLRRMLVSFVSPSITKKEDSSVTAPNSPTDVCSEVDPEKAGTGQQPSHPLGGGDEIVDFSLSCSPCTPPITILATGTCTNKEDPITVTFCLNGTQACQTTIGPRKTTRFSASCSNQSSGTYTVKAECGGSSQTNTIDVPQDCTATPPTGGS
jgi:hypothetical protein